MRILDRLFSRMIDRRIAAFQVDLVARHCDEVQNMYRQMRGWRHDYHNHIQTMKAHLAFSQMEELARYLDDLNQDLANIDTVLKTGNVMVDAILNSKLSLIKSHEISVHATAVVPSVLTVSEIDLCVIIGNLLDNALEACLKLTESHDRFIRIYIGRLKGQLYISISNAVGGEVNKQGHRYLSTKDAASHGFGLLRVDRIAEKYEGFVNRQNEDGVFATEIMLPL